MKGRMAAFVSSSVRTMWVGVAVALVISVLGNSALAVDLNVPEIDPGSAGSALALLTSGALILRARMRGK